MPGVSVHIKNENIGVTTDASGRYRLSANVDSTLVFSCLGFMSQEVAIEGRTLINVCLVHDIYELDSIVVSTTNRRMDISDGRIVVHLDRYNTKGKLLSEVMSKMPTIKVTEDEIKMFGKESVSVYINNHEVRLEGKSLVNYLNSFPPEIVSTVEIMSSSLTEYDANGNIGVIKLNMSRNVNPGLRGQVMTGYTRNHYNSGLVSSHIDYNGKNFYLNANVYGSIYQYCTREKNIGGEMTKTAQSVISQITFDPAPPSTSTHNPHREKTTYSEMTKTARSVISQITFDPAPPSTSTHNPHREKTTYSEMTKTARSVISRTIQRDSKVRHKDEIWRLRRLSVLLPANCGENHFYGKKHKRKPTKNYNKES